MPAPDLVTDEATYAAAQLLEKWGMTHGNIPAARAVLTAFVQALPGWQPISTHPRDDNPFLGMSADDRWPQPMKWEVYSAEDAEEIGEDGYWTYCEELIADVAGAAEPVWWRPMIDLPPGATA